MRASLYTCTLGAPSEDPTFQKMQPPVCTCMSQSFSLIIIARLGIESLATLLSFEKSEYFVQREITLCTGKPSFQTVVIVFYGRKVLLHYENY